PYRSAFVADLPGPEDDQPIEVMNVHLAAPHVRPVVQRLQERRGQLRDILPHLAGKPRRRPIVAGAPNATPLWPAYRRLRTRFDDAAAEAARRIGRRPGRTWGPWAGSVRLLRIDHILVKGLVAAGTRVLPLRGSDHSALVADLTLPTE